MFPLKSPQAHPLETPLELGDPNCPSSRKLQTTFPSHNTHHAQLEKPSTAHWSPPSRTHNCLSVPLSTKYTLRIRNLCAQHDTVAESNKSHIVTCVCVNAIRTILQFTLVTHGHLLRVRLGATKGTNIPIITHNILIIIVLLCRCSPYMCRYVFPRTIWRVPYLSSNQNCCKCKSARTYSCNSVPDPLHMFLTMPQCHRRANKFSGVPNKGNKIRSQSLR